MTTCRKRNEKRWSSRGRQSVLKVRASQSAMTGRMVRGSVIKRQRHGPNASAMMCQKCVRFLKSARVTEKEGRPDGLGSLNLAASQDPRTTSRGNRTAIELFLTGLHTWSKVIIALVD